MKIYSNKNVYESTIERINYLFDEFPNIIISISGGKDSTVILNISLQIAKEKKRLPLKVLFVDQEAEWQCTREYIQCIMNSKDIDPIWLQIPILKTNACTHNSKKFYCWDNKEKEKWITSKSKIAIKNNVFGVDTFKNMFKAVTKTMYPALKTCYISGVRAAESPSRSMGMTEYRIYKHITYGKVLNKKLQHYTFYPIYDWEYTDVWKYINDNKIKYNKIYDYMYNYGMPINKMRLTNLYNRYLYDINKIQEIEPETWNKLILRMEGSNTVARLHNDDKIDLPYMFINWKEYRDHLVDSLITVIEDREIYKKKFCMLDIKYCNHPKVEKMYKECVNTIIWGDTKFKKLTNFEKRPEVYLHMKYLKTGVKPNNEKYIY